MSRIILLILFGIIFQFASATPGGRYCSYVEPSEGRIICRLRCLEECDYGSGTPDKSEHHCAQVVFEQNEVGTKTEYGCEANSNSFVWEMQTHIENLTVISFSHLEFQKLYILNETEVQNGFLQSVHEYQVYSCLYKEQLEIISSTSWSLTTTTTTTLSQTTSKSTSKSTSKTTSPITSQAKDTTAKTTKAKSISSSRMNAKIIEILGIVIIKIALV